MSALKVSGRSRPLENHRPLPLYRASNLDIEDEVLVDRSAPQMPTGMEKEEEEEVHLQEIMKQQMTNSIKETAAIPIPEIFTTPLQKYTEIYPHDFKMPTNHYIRSTDRIDMDPPPQYDVDEEDMKWLAEFNENPKHVEKNNGKKLDALRYETIVDIFETAQEQIADSGGLITLDEAARTTLDEPEYNFAEILYNRWASRAKDRLTVMYRTKKAVVVNGQQLQSSEVDPYVAFRAHRARMQTRRNRKSEEQNYEKMIKLRRDFEQLRQLAVLVRQREIAKEELQDVSCRVFKMEYALGEWKQPRKEKQVAKFKLKLNPQRSSGAGGSASSKATGDKSIGKKATVSSQLSQLECLAFFRKYGRFVHTDLGLDETDGDGDEADTEEDIDAMIGNARDIFTVFDHSLNSIRIKRKKGCRYHETLDSLYVPRPAGFADKSHKDFKELSNRGHRVRFGRRRIGRGGRLWFDRRLPACGDTRKEWDDDHIEADAETEDVCHLNQNGSTGGKVRPPPHATNGLGLPHLVTSAPTVSESTTIATATMTIADVKAEKSVLASSAPATTSLDNGGSGSVPMEVDTLVDGNGVRGTQPPAASTRMEIMTEPTEVVLID